MTTSSAPGGWYDARARDLVAAYEAVDPDRLHAWLVDLLPAEPGLVLDVGAGSGRDAAWFARLGHSVVAVEPADAMRAEARARHAERRYIASGAVESFSPVRWTSTTACPGRPGPAAIYGTCCRRIQR